MKINANNYSKLPMFHFSAISHLVEKHGFELMCWEDRYSKGTWAVCLPGFDQARAVRDASEDGDLDMFEATGYLLNSTWLPVVTAPTLLDSLASLEERIGVLDIIQLTDNSDWGIATYEALEHLKEQLRRSKRKYRQLPVDFSIIARAVERQRTEGGEVTW